jgi:hypothetical protein
MLLNQMMVTNDLDVRALTGLVFPKRPRQQERHHMIDLTFDSERSASRRAWLASLRRMMMATLAAILCSLLLMLGTGVGAEPCHLLSRAIVRQVLALLTASDLCFNRLVAALAGRRFDRRDGGRAFE